MRDVASAIDDASSHGVADAVIDAVGLVAMRGQTGETVRETLAACAQATAWGVQRELPPRSKVW